MTCQHPMLWRAPACPRSQPLIIAHRGASAIAPDNTMAAFRAAFANHADAFETDIVLTRDNIAVCHHDLVYHGREPSETLVIRASACADIQRTAPDIPSLTDACDVPLPIFLDIKEEKTADIEFILASPDVEADPLRFVVAVNSLAVAEVIHACQPAIAQVSLMETVQNREFSKRLPGHWIRLRHKDANAQSIRHAKDAGMQVMVTCAHAQLVGHATASDILDLALAGADALIVNDPALVRAALQQLPVSPGP